MLNSITEETKEEILIKEKKSKKIKKKEFKMTEEEKEMNRKILKNMQIKSNYTRNPRFKENVKIMLYSNPMFKDIKNKENPFVVEPPIVIFRDYQLNCIYEIELKLINRIQLLTNFKYVPPKTYNNSKNRDNFTIKQIIYPKKDSSLIAPGMCAKIKILFNPTSLNNFEDDIQILTEKFAFKVMLKAFKDQPALSLENPMNCTKCLVGDQISMMFRCKNNGGDAHFKFLPNDINSSNYQNINNLSSTNNYSNSLNSNTQHSPESEVFNIFPFSIFPQEFYLYKGMAIDIFVNFSPIEEGMMENDLILCCDSKVNLPYKIRGEGILIDLKLVSVDNILLEGISEKLESFYFDRAFPNSFGIKHVKFENLSSVIVKYHWSIYENSDKLVNLKDSESIFSIEPNEGIFNPQETIEFIIKFFPKNPKIYEYKLDLILEDIPFQSIKNLHNNYVANDKSHIPNVAKGQPFMISLNSPYPSYPVFSYTLKGCGRPCEVTIDPILIDFGDVYLNNQIKKSFKISNKNKGIAIFQLNKIHQKLFIKKNFQINNYFKTLNMFRDSKFTENFASEEINFFKLSTNYTQKDRAEASDDINDVVKKNSKFENKKTNQMNMTQNSKKITKSSIMTTNHIEQIPEYEVNSNQIFTTNDEKFVEFNIIFLPTKNGIFKSTIIFDVKEGKSICLEIRAHIIGPKLKISSPCLDFGLMSIQEVKTVNFKIMNDSPVPANILIKDAAFKNVNFSNYIEDHYLEDMEGELTGPIVKEKIRTIMDYENNDNEFLNLSNDYRYLLKFSTAYAVLSPKQEIDITVYFASPSKYIYDSQIEVMVENSNSYYVSIYANVQEAYAYLSYLYINPKAIFLSMPLQHDNNVVDIVNPSNLPVHFEWENITIPDELFVEFYPQSGFVNPKSSFSIKYKIIYYKSGLVDNLLICNIREMDIPLGLVIQGRVTGLDILYELTDDTLSYMISKFDTSSMTSSNFSIASSDKSKSRIRASKTTFFDKKLNILDFRHLQVNKHQNASFIIKNNSGIQTTFKLFVEHYKAGGLEKTLKNEMMNKSIKTEEFEKSDRDNSKMSVSLTKSTNLNRVSIKKNSKVVIPHKILNDAHEAYNFTSAKGAEFTKLKQIEKDSVLYLSNKKGVAIVVSPSEGFLDKNSEVTITVSIYNDCVGDFEDELVSHIKGLPEVRFPMNIKIRGNPLQLSPFQPGIDYVAVPPVLKMGNVLTKSNMLEKVIKLLNTGSNTISVCWRIYNYNDIIQPRNNIFDIKIAEKVSRGGKGYKLQYNAIAPPEISEEKLFEIYPLEAEIGPKGTKDFKLSFKCNSDGRHSALIVAYPILSNVSISSNNKIKLTELALKIDALGISPHITVDKSKKIDDSIEYKFCVHSFGASPRPKRSIVLINEQKINLITRLNVEGPFKIMNIEPKQCLISENLFNIMPSSNLKVDIKFLSPNPDDDKEWNMTLVNEKYGKLRLSFENQEFQEFILRGVLKRPRLKLSTTGNESQEGPNILDFGKVNVESERRSHIWIINETEVDTKCQIYHYNFQGKKVYGYKTISNSEQEDIDKVDDPSVFIIETSEKLLSGPSNQLTNMPLFPCLTKIPNPLTEKYNPWKVQIIFKPKLNVFYKSRYVISADTGNKIELILKGHGSYYEEFL